VGYLTPTTVSVSQPYRRRLPLPFTHLHPALAESRCRHQNSYIPSYHTHQRSWRRQLSRPADLLPGAGKIPALGGFSRNKNIPNRFMIDADGMNPKRNPYQYQNPSQGVRETNWGHWVQIDVKVRRPTDRLMLSAASNSLAPRMYNSGIAWRDWFEGTHLVRWVRLLAETDARHALDMIE